MKRNINYYITQYFIPNYSSIKGFKLFFTLIS